ncbi:MAG: Nif3-like dinuclear metal center hexameric protein [Oscillospiraceae bacterium]|nr:Nif3-like dinuclear metal center hexameric protein [Oscillospiraceae bacterium]
MQQVSVQDVLRLLEQLAPPALAEGWDNVGLLVESEGPVTGILTVLDITDAAVEEAIARGYNLIAAHHPVIFRPVKSLHYNNVIYKMAQAGISAICMHTNLDCAAGGTGDTLAALLGLQNVQTYAVDGDENLGRIGTLLQPMSMPQLAALCRDVLHTPVRYVENSRAVSRVAVVTGSGDYIEDALAAGADALVTGEVGYHKAMDAAAAGLGVVEAGHFGTEAPIAAVLKEKLAAAFPALPVRVSETMKDVFRTL